jgi:hypothetical protein
MMFRNFRRSYKVTELPLDGKMENIDVDKLKKINACDHRSRCRILFSIGSGRPSFLHSP